MKKHFYLIAASVLALTALLAACGSTPATPVPAATSTPPATSTLDPCGPDNIDAEVQKVHKFMREFDDAATLAVNLPGESLADAIADLQRIRRDAEEQTIPPCLADLKTYQVSHMNTVINTLIAHMGGSPRELVDQGIALARQQHDQYVVELARVLGLTIEPATPMPSATEGAPLPVTETPTP